MAGLEHGHAAGEIRKVMVHAGHRGPKEIGVQPEFLAWLTDPDKNGAGALFDFGCYGANLMTWLMNDARPVSVTAVTQRIKPVCRTHASAYAEKADRHCNLRSLQTETWR